MKTITLALLLLLGGCAQHAAIEQPRDGRGDEARGAEEADTARIARLEAAARALARAEGCGQAAQCRTAPVGDRPCGGPRGYLVYCAAATNSAALFRALDELREAEREYNARHGLVSTCELRMPPQTRLEGQTCRAVPTGPAEVRTP